MENCKPFVVFWSSCCDSEAALPVASRRGAGGGGARGVIRRAFCRRRARVYTAQGASRGPLGPTPGRGEGVRAAVGPRCGV